MPARRTMREGGYDSIADGKGSFRDILKVGLVACLVVILTNGTVLVVDGGLVSGGIREPKNPG